MFILKKIKNIGNSLNSKNWIVGGLITLVLSLSVVSCFETQNSTHAFRRSTTFSSSKKILSTIKSKKLETTVDPITLGVVGVVTGVVGVGVGVGQIIQNAIESNKQREQSKKTGETLEVIKEGMEENKNLIQSLSKQLENIEANTNKTNDLLEKILNTLEKQNK